MKIAIDISQSIYGTGVSVYTRNLTSNLIKLFPEDEYVLFGGSLRRHGELLRLAKKLKGHPEIYPLPPTLMDFLWNSLHIIPLEIFTGAVDLVHTSDWTEPPSQHPKVTTVHDLIPFLYPQTATDSIRNAHKKKLAWVVRESKKIIAVSHSTKNDLISILKVPQEKIVVIPEGVEERYVPQPQEIIEMVKRRYQTGDNYIFTLSTIEPRKNQAALIDAYKIIRQEYPDLKLLIAGRFRGDSILSPVEGVILPGYVPDADMPALYAGCQAFVLPSLYEGFGLSSLQAMACGAAVAVSNVSSLPEVVGDAGVLFDPRSIDSIATGIIKTIKDRNALRTKSLKQSQKYTWKKTAIDTHRVYQEVYSEFGPKNKL